MAGDLAYKIFMYLPKKFPQSYNLLLGLELFAIVLYVPLVIIFSVWFSSKHGSPVIVPVSPLYQVRSQRRRKRKKKLMSLCRSITQTETSPSRWPLSLRVMTCTLAEVSMPHTLPPHRTTSQVNCQRQRKLASHQNFLSSRIDGSDPHRLGRFL